MNSISPFAKPSENYPSRPVDEMRSDELTVTRRSAPPPCNAPLAPPNKNQFQSSYVWEQWEEWEKSCFSVENSGLPVDFAILELTSDLNQHRIGVFFLTYDLKKHQYKLQQYISGCELLTQFNNWWQKQYLRSEFLPPALRSAWP